MICNDSVQTIEPPREESLYSRSCKPYPNLAPPKPTPAHSINKPVMLSVFRRTLRVQSLRPSPLRMQSFYSLPFRVSSYTNAPIGGLVNRARLDTYNFVPLGIRHASGRSAKKPAEQSAEKPAGQRAEKPAGETAQLIGLVIMLLSVAYGVDYVFGDSSQSAMSATGSQT
jgi:hypothetical protein